MASTPPAVISDGGQRDECNTDDSLIQVQQQGASAPSDEPSALRDPTAPTSPRRAQLQRDLQLARDEAVFVARQGWRCTVALRYSVKRWLQGTGACLIALGLLQCLLAWVISQATVGFTTLHAALLRAPLVLDFLMWSGWRVAIIALAVHSTTRISGLAAGSGIPDMKSLLSGYDLREHVSFRTGAAKVVGLVLACGSGLPVGREGPLVHIAGCIAMMLLNTPWFARLKSSKEGTYQVLGAACAVGVTSAFGSPIGGVLFSIEVTATYYLTSSYFRAFLTAVSGCIVFKAIASFGWGTEVATLGVDFDVASSRQALFAALLPHGVLGILLGLLAGCFIKLAAAIAHWRQRPWVVARVGLGLALPCLLAAISAVVEYTAGNYMQLGLIESLSELTSRVDLNSATSEAPQMSNVNATTMIENQSPAQGADWGGQFGVAFSVATWVVWKFVLAASVMSMPMPCGVLLPAMAIGAGAGRVYGMLLHSWGWSAWPTNDFAVAGAAAFAGGVTGTISIAVIVFELTNQLHFALPLLIATLLSRHMVAFVSEPYYDVFLRLAQLPIPPATALARMSHVPLSHVMTEPVHVLPRKLTTAELAQQLHMFPEQHIFPVVDSVHLGSGLVYIGPVLRTQLESFPAPPVIGITLPVPGSSDGADETASPTGLHQDVDVHVDLMLDRRVDMDLAMTQCLRLPATTTVGDIALLFSIHRCKMAFVTEHGRLVGMVSMDSMNARSTASQYTSSTRLPRPPHLTTYLTTERDGLPRDSQIMAC